MAQTLGDKLLAGWLAGAHLSFKNADAERRYTAKAKRIIDTIQLKIPDRIPVVPCATQKFAFEYAGATYQDAMYDFDKIYDAYIKQYTDIDFDAYVGPDFIYPGGMFDQLQWKRIKLPGNHLPSNRSFQFAEGEYMKEDEYDEFLDDPSDWILRKYLPRLSPPLEPLAKLPSFHNIINYYHGLHDFVFAVADNPEVLDAFKALKSSGEVVGKWYDHLSKFEQQLGEHHGVPHLLGGCSHAPYDVICNYFRGWRGAIGDLYRRPEKMLKMMERLLPWMIEYGLSSAESMGNPIVTLYIYKGADNFMSDSQFETFYWPTLKELIRSLVDQGLLVWIFTQGTYDSRLKYFAEIPSGTCLIHLESGSDIFKAKEILKDKQCIEGNVPNTMLANGTPDDVAQYCRKLLTVCGEGGGYMMDFSAFLDDAKRENVRKMVDITKQYGQYDSMGRLKK
jgi:uroporphyrinogen-III decarboxylase